MKALKTKVILSGIVLVFAFIATIGTTFAWFTVSQTATVDTMTLNVTAEENLVIRLRDFSGGTFETTPTDLTDVSKYKTTLTVQDLYQKGYLAESFTGTYGTFEPVDPWRLQPSTIINPGYTVVNGTTLSVISNIDDVDRTLTAATPNNDLAGDYIEIQLYLYNQSLETQYIEMTDISIDATVAGENLLVGQADVANAVRISVFEGEKSGTPGTAYIFGNDIDYTYEFLPNIAGHSTVNSALFTADFTFNQLSDLTTNNPVGTLPSTHFDLGSYDEGTEIAPNNMQDILIMSAESSALVTVYIYVEGWDAEASNSIINSYFNITFGFKFGQQD